MGYQLKAAGERLKDAKIIDAYERAYNVAQAVGADGRELEIPPMRDRQTMARRVRAYVAKGKPVVPARSSEAQSSRGRKALATMGRRGGQKAAERWKTDPDGEYAQENRQRLRAANKRREMTGELLELRVKTAILDARSQSVADPSTRELAGELGVSERRIQQVRKALGMEAKRGRPRAEN